MSAASPVPPVRRMDFDFDEGAVPAHWFGDDRILTRSSDALHLLFPSGERFFVRSVRHFSKRLESPELKERVRGFVGQEAMHGREHERAFALLARDGIEVGSFLQSYESFLQWMEDRSSPLFNLAVTCALEHLTATLGANSFFDPMMEDAHPTMHDLMMWHAAEEIEHKSVAFDVYRSVGGGYAMRVVAMAFAYGFLMVWWRRGMVHLLEQDGGFDMAEVRAFRRRARARGSNLPLAFQRALASYLRPSFHPDDSDDYHLAVDYFESVGRLAS
ncbi:MAG TPA: metal-dependent hydrolase [Deltaproteobacteria bacterium]|nr:metal-dependent hydrolase [Deltaproteobacteria bacterium]